ncbi:hypothetical protein J7337_003514 [Fusarium musae]|uniref:Uncharacterized protein n=1 Tax=Fusarium musae TaxID=1042133 RepID=A0A9P8DKJ1_9HYPO|nr:hypothetical protein J7337_003514 [Fusarium musae]KAG9503563.1 hypothetical protein J7337_003514 [Fusarium musae]
MSTQVIDFQDSHHFYHKGVESRPKWAFDEARKQIIAKYGRLMSAMPNTAHVVFQDFEGKGNGGSVARIGVFVGDLSVTGAGSKTKAPTVLSPSRQWETWFDVHYQVKLIFVSSNDEGKVSTGKSIEEINNEIERGTQGASPDWLYYKMKYSLHVFNYNGMGERRNAIFETEFYPLQRRFFTKFEQKLDIILLESIYNLLKNAEVDDSQSSIKLNTNIRERQNHPVDNASSEETILRLTKSRKRQDIDLYIMPADFGGLALMPLKKTYKLMTLNEKPHMSREAVNREGKGKSGLSRPEEKALLKDQQRRARLDGDSGKSDNDPIEDGQNHGRPRPKKTLKLKKSLKS